MKRILFLIAIFCTLTANAQNLFISFAGTGAANSVDSVKVENLMAGTSLTLKANEILHLTGTVGIPSLEYEKNAKLKIYPNPMKAYSMIEIFPSGSGDAIITVLDMTGRQLSQTHNYLDKSRQELRLSGLKNGFYLINVRGNNYQYSGKILCTGQSDGTLSIEKVSNNIEVIDDKTLKVEKKGVQDGGTVDMAYTPGDRIKYTGYSGTYGTVTTDIPSQDKTVTFTFIPCSIGGNSYLTVKIGSQTWMANNLSTAYYNDGSLITEGPYVATSTPAYCWYNNVPDLFYGALYNWYAVNTGKLCPTGWRVPSDFEWIELAVSLGGENVSGGKLKETGTSHWIYPNYAATNEFGFTALPAGRYDGSFRNHGYAGSWWTSEEIPGGSYAYYRSIYNESASVIKIYYEVKINFFSVRCIKD
jgi:uncharacterized protein (TIGR02145 family)